MEIQDQLKIVNAVLTYQLEVLQLLARNFPHLDDNDIKKHPEKTEKDSAKTQKQKVRFEGHLNVSQQFKFQLFLLTRVREG